MGATLSKDIFENEIFQSNNIIHCELGYCEGVHRLIEALQFYESLDVANNGSHQSKLIQFVNDKYKLLLTDYIHLITIHNNDVDIIAPRYFENRNIVGCDVQKCELSFRHNRNTQLQCIYSQQDLENIQNPLFIFYCDTFDSIHCYLCHLKDFGLRLDIKDANKQHKSLTQTQNDVDAFSADNHMVPNDVSLNPMLNLSYSPLSPFFTSHATVVPNHITCNISPLPNFIPPFYGSATQLDDVDQFPADNQSDKKKFVPSHQMLNIPYSQPSPPPYIPYENNTKLNSSPPEAKPFFTSHETVVPNHIQCNVMPLPNMLPSFYGNFPNLSSFVPNHSNTQIDTKSPSPPIERLTPLVPNHSAPSIDTKSPPPKLFIPPLPLVPNDIGRQVTDYYESPMTMEKPKVSNYDVFSGDLCTDKEFDGVCASVASKKNDLLNDRFNFNKFSITAPSFNEEYHSNSNATLIDDLYQYITENGGKMVEMDRLHRKLNDELYDSDAIMEDFDAVRSSSNISQFFQTMQCFRSFTEFMTLATKKGISFSIGYIFYYWEYYKEEMEICEQHTEHLSNKNDHSGYHPHQLYIAAKYSSIKEEILKNTICSLTLGQYQESLTKAGQYLDTETVKQIVAFENYPAHWDPLHYQIKPGTKFAQKNVLSLIIYCDWNELSRNFTSTFRKIKSYEQLSSIKSRNGEYANWSKTLRETVQCFGKMGWRDTKDSKWNEKYNREKGPFFCGMACIMAIPEFNIRLCSPTSTSKHLEVATRFGGDKGMILQLNNNTGDTNGFMLRCFDCSWLSRYSGENERLFIGGDWRIRVETIRNINTGNNYHAFFKPLFYFDCMVSGSVMDNVKQPKIEKRDKFILTQLIKYKLGNVNDNKEMFKQYVYETFDAFCDHKTQIILNLFYIMKFFDELKDLVLDSSLQTNLFKSNLFKIFPNVNEIVIYTAANALGGYMEHPINLVKLLSIIENKPSFVPVDVKIVINATHKYKWIEYENRNDYENEYLDESWIAKEWKKLSTKLKSEEKNWKMSFKQSSDGTHYSLVQDSITIKRIFCRSEVLK